MSCLNDIIELQSGNIFIRKLFLPKIGDRVDGHFHAYDHTLFLLEGKIKVQATMPDGIITLFKLNPKEHFLVRKDVIHEITALEDNTEFWCVYSHRNSQGEIVQEFTGWNEAYSGGRETQKLWQ